MKKILLVSSTGGHFAQLKELMPIMDDYHTDIITIKNQYLTEQPYFFKFHPGRNPLKYLYILVESIKFFFTISPDIIITTGSGIAIPICIIGRLFHKKVIFIETFSRIFHPSVSGRFLGLIAHNNIVQWKDLLIHFPRVTW